MSNFIWQEAEDSFLQYFCKIESFTWGRRYFWEEGGNEPKFNAIRFLKPSLTNEDFHHILDEQYKWFQERSRSLWVKIPSAIPFQEELATNLKISGTILP